MYSKKLLISFKQQNANITIILNYLLCQCRFLFRRTKLKELLYHIVPEHVCHQAIRSPNDFVEHHLFLLDCRSFQFLLNEPARKRHYLLTHICLLPTWVINHIFYYFERTWNYLSSYFIVFELQLVLRF